MIESQQRHAFGPALTMLLLNMIDGFDVLAMSYAALGAGRAFGLDALHLGALFTIGFAGMAVGAFGLASIADRFGRVPALMLFLSMIAPGMALSAMAGSFGQLAASRILTGLGVGAMMPVINAVVAESAAPTRRAWMIGLAQTGFPLGGLLGGLLAGAILESHGWRAIFWAGAGFSAMGLACVWLTLQESSEWRDRLHGERALGVRRTGSGLRVLVRENRLPTIIISICYLFAMAGYYSLVSWLPKLASQEGATTAAAVRLVAASTAGSIVGGLAFGGIARLIGLSRSTWVGFAAAAVVLALISLIALGQLSAVLPFFLGIAIGTGLTGLFALLATIYPVAVRATAAGVAVGAGRVGAMIGPLLCGALLQAGQTTPVVFGAMAAMCGLAAVVLMALKSPQGQGSHLSN